MKNKAFTLIEVLIVVLIIAILAAIAVPKYQKAVEKSKISKMITAARALNEAQQRYILANGVSTIHFSDLDIDFPGERLEVSVAKDNCGTGTHLVPGYFSDSIIDMGDFELGIMGHYVGGRAQGTFSVATLKDSPQHCRQIVFLVYPGVMASQGREPVSVNAPLCYNGNISDDWCWKTFGLATRYSNWVYPTKGAALTGALYKIP